MKASCKFSTRINNVHLTHLDIFSLILNGVALVITLNSHFFSTPKQFILSQISFLSPIIISCFSTEQLINNKHFPNKYKKVFRPLPLSFILITLLLLTFTGTFMGKYNVLDWVTRTWYVFLLVTFEFCYLLVKFCYQSKIKEKLLQ